MIENNARRLKAARVVPFQPLPLDFAKLVAERRADRVGAHVRREATNRHADDIQQRVNAENQRNERERIGNLLRVGAVPDHLLTTSIQQALDTRDPTDPLVRGKDLRDAYNHEHKDFPAAKRMYFWKYGDGTIRDPLLGDFEPDQEGLSKVKRSDRLFANSVVVRFNQMVGARNAAYLQSVQPGFLAALKTAFDDAADAKTAADRAPTLPATPLRTPGTPRVKAPPTPKRRASAPGTPIVRASHAKASPRSGPP